MRLLIRLLFYPIMALLVVAFLAFYFLWFTERGSKFLLGEVASRIEGVSFTYVKGTVSTGVVLRDVTYSTGQLDLAASEATVRPSLPALLRLQAGFVELSVQSLDVRYHRVDEPPGSSTPTDVGVPVIIEHARVDDLSVQIGESEPRQFRMVEAAVRLWRDTLTLDRVAVVHPIGRLQGKGTIGLNEPFAIDSEFRITGPAVADAPAATLAARGQARGTAEEIDISGQLEIPGSIPFTARILPGGSPQYQVTAGTDTVDLEPLIAAPVSLEQFQFELTGDGPEYRFKGGSKVANPWMPGIATTFAGSGSSTGVKLATARFDTDDASLQADGEFTFAPRQLTAKVRGTVNAQDVQGDAAFTIPSAQEIEGRARLVAGKNRLGLATKVAGRFDIDIAADLSTLSPQLRGKIDGSGTLDLHELDYAFDASGGRLQYAEQVFEGVELHVQGKDRGSIAATAKVATVRRSGDALGGGKLAFAGSLDEGDVSVDWQHPRVKMSLRAHARNAGERVDGTITAGSVTVDEQSWMLSSNVGFTAAAELIEFGDHCWTHESANLCTTAARYANGKALLEFNLSNFAMRQLAADRLHVLADYEGGRYRVVADGGLDLSTTAGSDIVVEEGQVVLEGEGATYRYQGSAGIANPWLRDAAITLAGSGSAQQVVVDKATLTAADGSLAASGQFRFDSSQLVFSADGTWLERKLVGSGRFAGSPLAGDARMAVGGNVMVVRANEQGRIDLNLDAPDLASLDERLQGKVTATAHVETRSGGFQVDAGSERLAFASQVFNNVTLSGGNRPDGNVDALLKVQQWSYGDEVLGGGNLTFSGKPDDGELSVEWHQAFANVSLQSGLGYKDGVIAGSLHTAEVALGDARWRPDANVGFVIASDRVAVDDHCWRYEAASLCLTDSGMQAHKGRLNVTLSDLPLQLREPWFAPDIAVDTTIAANVTGSADFSSPTPVYNGEMRIEMPRLRLGYFDDQELIAEARSSIRIRDNRLAGDVAVKSDRGDAFTAFVRLPDVGKPRALRGEARLATGDLGVVTAFVPQLDRAQGSLDAKFTVDTVSSPSIANVSVDVSDDASVVVPAAGITLRRLTASAHGDADDIRVALSAKSGEGDVHVDGTWHSPLTPARVLNLSVTGTGFQVLQRADVSLVASPELTVVYRNSGAIGIDGKLTVEDGSFRLRGGSEIQLRRPSADVVVVSREGEATRPLELDLRLDVAVKHFSVDMYGLVADVEGGVVLTQTGSSLRRAVGNLNLVNGTFSRYGQSFVVERGRLIFSGPLSNPLVDVVSSRTINEAARVVKVTLVLSGPANNIKSTITSEPPMSSANALSYLVLGRPLDSASAAEGRSLSSAAISLGLKQAMPITEEIRSALGLTELGVVGNGADSTSVIAGKRINPDLYVQYNYDVFSRIGGILFSYQLTSKLSVETRTGEAKSMTLIYTFE